MTRFHCYIAAFTGIIVLPGCGSQVVHGVADSGSSWTTSANSDSTPGVDFASVTFVRLMAGPEKGVAFVVWSDLANGNSGSGGGGGGKAQYTGQHRSTGGPSLVFHAATTDGETGNITIAGVSYDLADGALFLVSTQHDTPLIVQLEFDTAGFPKGKDQLVRLAESHPDIRDFFDRHKSKNDGVAPPATKPQ